MPTRPPAPPLVPRATACHCGRPVFFRNSECLACKTALGYDPESARLLALEQVRHSSLWREVGARRGSMRYRRCANLQGPVGCNWLLRETDITEGALCRCCRLTRTWPDLTVEQNRGWVARIAMAQRRLLSIVIALGLPAWPEGTDPVLGLRFDLLRQLDGGPPVITGHADGLITLDVAEAEDAEREKRRSALKEPYRTLLGHLRHEVGHYYWQRLVQGSAWLAPYRALFGDERADYAAALAHHHANGPPADWGGSHVSAYASSHPWEDWAETFAHYLHLVDTLDTARGFGVDGNQVELSYERWSAADLTPESRPTVGPPPDAGLPTVDPAAFIDLVNEWMELTGVLNELSSSMGLPDFYPFVLSRPALRKLYFVHRVVQAQRAKAQLGSRQQAPQIKDRKDRVPEDESADPVGDGHSDSDLAALQRPASGA